MNQAQVATRRVQTWLYLAWVVNAIVNCLAPHMLARLDEPYRQWLLRNAVATVGEVAGGGTPGMPHLWISAALLAGMMMQVAFWQRLRGLAWQRFLILAAVGGLLSLAHLPWLLVGPSVADGTELLPTSGMLAVWVGKLVGLSVLGSLAGYPIARRLPVV